ncbi:hypothetical protein HMPREF0762_01712 [Slackia exigua ATCC 700122]|uniref:Uncharacterized protein n=1 Tax=Slackia exigua (strain ATCC 700122 / DSM 15923 / CIP 105133 / JCM 11022 / KCTC 5966 / S-7) TaxID=649764 RepID=D0WIN7_SLAES|nr:hypothetical protein HMPREF0762_01712 [Slackia exigua ATCC 700122]
MTAPRLDTQLASKDVDVAFFVMPNPPFFYSSMPGIFRGYLDFFGRQREH